MTLDFDVKVINEMANLTLSLDARLSSLSKDFDTVKNSLSIIVSNLKMVDQKLDDKRISSNVTHTVQRAKTPLPSPPDGEDRSDTMTAEKMTKIMKIMAGHQRLESENFNIFRVGTVEFASIGEFEATDEAASQLDEEVVFGQPVDSDSVIEEQDQLPSAGIDTESSKSEIELVMNKSETELVMNKSETKPDFATPQASGDIKFALDIQSNLYSPFTTQVSVDDALLFAQSDDSDSLTSEPASVDPVPVPAPPSLVESRPPIPLNFIEELNLRRKRVISSSSDGSNDGRQPVKPRFLNKSRTRAVRNRRPPTRRQNVKVATDQNSIVVTDQTVKVVTDEEKSTGPTAPAHLSSETTVDIVDSSDIDTDDLFD